MMARFWWGLSVLTVSHTTFLEVKSYQVRSTVVTTGYGSVDAHPHSSVIGTMMRFPQHTLLLNS
jgi:hypothetical protein